MLLVERYYMYDEMINLLTVKKSCVFMFFGVLILLVLFFLIGF